MSFIGHLRKMQAKVAPQVEYSLVLDDQLIPLNDYLGRHLQLRFTGQIHCVQCGRKTQTSFQQGHCYPCMQRLAECHFCIIHPEKCCIAHTPCPENDWAHAQCGQPHTVYLANSSGLKVGITRQSQVPTRWIDQGAGQALPIFHTTNRYQAGIIEVCLKQFISDRTDWRKLLRGLAPVLDLEAERVKLLQKAEAPLRVAMAQFPQGDIVLLTQMTETQLAYPVNRYPEKIVSCSFDSMPIVGGELHGIKGQYLIFDTGVINIRKFSGYEVELGCIHAQ